MTRLTVWGEACPACGSTESSSRGAKDGWPWISCRDCATQWTTGSTTPFDVEELYADGYAEEEPIPAFVWSSLEAVVASAEPHRMTGRWLDYGFGQGDLLRCVEAHGWDVFGTEIARRPLERARARGWTVSDRPGDDGRFQAGSFDVVSMVEVLEHVPFPGELLSEAARWLRPGGLLYLTTPNARSLNARWLGLSWSVVSPPDHVLLWSVAGLRIALARHGFRMLRLRTDGLNPSEIGRSLRPRTAGNEPLHRDREARRLVASLSSSRPRRAVKRAINSALTVLRAGDTIKVWAATAPT
jgi:SAM-dependent methyltransferase